MKNSISLLRSNRIYFLSLLIFLFTGFLLLLLNGNAATAIPLNASHPFWLNVFFINYTFIGDGFFAVILIAVYLFYFKKKQQGLALLYSFLLSAIAVQIIKNCINFPQVKFFFEQGQYLFYTGDLSFSAYSGFPSGHTAVTFAIATVFILTGKNKKWQLPILAAAILAAYSRMYLAQHAALDVLIGAMLGSVSGLVAVQLAYHAKGFKFSFQKMHRHKSGTAVPSFN